MSVETLEGPAEAARREILDQHLALRELLPPLEALAERYEQAEEASELGDTLRTAALDLYERFGAHLDREQALLTPLLRRAGERGERFLHRLEHEHHEQRELLHYLLSRLRSHPMPSLLIARELQNFAAFLRIEMEHEEKTLLAPDVLEAGDR